jgi:hypothetical protein
VPDSCYPAAAVPYLIGLPADDGAPDRTLGHELLTALSAAIALRAGAAGAGKTLLVLCSEHL